MEHPSKFEQALELVQEYLDDSAEGEGVELATLEDFKLWLEVQIPVGGREYPDNV